FMAAGAVANFLFAFLVFVVIGLIGLPEVVGARVGIAEVEPGTPVAELGLQSGDFIERVDGDYFDDDDALFERLRQSIGQPVTLQVRRVASEPHEILMLDVVPTTALLDMLESTGTYVFVIEVDAESPAGEAGLLPGDLIAAINGISLTDATDPTTELQMLTERFAGQDVPLEILRDGEILTVRLTPRLDPPPGGGRIGVTIRSEQVNPESGFIYVETEQRDFIPQPPLVALEYGIDRTMTILGMIVEFPARLLGGDTDPVERRVVSVVGVSQLGGAILQDSIQEEQSGILFEYIALISIALGFTNLLPIPALDGGRILFVVLEMIRGKPIPPEREGYVHMIGLIFLLTAAVFFIINDLVNPLTDILR
ncbi:MAG: RIP metalloprotease RseP, partial [Phototrophicaceae bacterium]